MSGSVWGERDVDVHDLIVRWLTVLIGGITATDNVADVCRVIRVDIMDEADLLIREAEAWAQKSAQDILRLHPNCNANLENVAEQLCTVALFPQIDLDVVEQMAEVRAALERHGADSPLESSPRIVLKMAALKDVMQQPRIAYRLTEIQSTILQRRYRMS